MPIGIKDTIDEAAAANEYVGAARKAELADKQLAFWILAAKPKVDSQFGDQVMYTIKCKQWGDGTFTLAFTHNDDRERKAAAIQRLLDEHPGEIAGPAYLGRHRTSKGNDYWELHAEPQQPRDETITTTSQPAAPAPSVTDADIPF